MSIPEDAFAPLQHHTFGRSHTVPPPLPESILQKAGATGVAEPVSDMHAGRAADAFSLDLDQLVRAVGEW